MKVDRPHEFCDGMDISETLRNAVDKCCKFKTGKIILPRGKYIFKDEKSIRDFKNLMIGNINPDTKWGRCGIPFNRAVSFKNCDNLVIDGQGSTIIFEGLIQPFEFINCSNVLIKNISIDWNRPMFSEGRVLNNENDTIKAKIFDNYFINGGEPVWSFQDYDPATRRFGVFCPFCRGTSMELIAPQVVRFKFPDSGRVQIGSYLMFRHIGNYRPALYFFNCTNVNVENVTINANPGMGIIGHSSKDFIFRKLKVIPRDERIMSVNTDAAHFISCTGTIDFEDCYFQGMGDDAVNVHSFYFSVKKRFDDRTILATIEAVTQDCLFDSPSAGDCVEFIRRDTLLPYASGKIKFVETDPEDWSCTIRFSQPLPESFDNTDLISNVSRTAKLRFVRCLVKNIRARGLLIQTRGVIVKDCTFDHCTGTGIHIDTATGWFESMGVRDIVIRDNRFIGCGYGPGTYKRTSGISVLTECEIPVAGVHRNITIKNNYIKGPGDTGIYISCTDGAVICKNNIEEVKNAIKIQYSNNIKLYENRTDR
ncbi:MAG: right-handed parallel beta-helix repeat-containing protein [Clostridiales bacterium]|nr:right-handed parallel beta-helix repeat-containing protein [Clostridiales bacterium]